MLQTTLNQLPIYTPEELIAFEREIADAYSTAAIRAPIHLSGGNEVALIDIFKWVKPEDWCFSTWRSHYVCLLKNVPRERLKADILAGHSITLNYREQRVVTSAIVGGICPIAMGLAWSIKRKGGAEHVWLFCGDMTSESGIFHECRKYAQRHDLPVTFVIENNGLSVCTPTYEVWGGRGGMSTTVNDKHTIYYEYDLSSRWPHSGIGVRINF